MLRTRTLMHSVFLPEEIQILKVFIISDRYRAWLYTNIKDYWYSTISSAGSEIQRMFIYTFPISMRHVTTPGTSVTALPLGNESHVSRLRLLVIGSCHGIYSRQLPVTSK